MKGEESCFVFVCVLIHALVIKTTLLTSAFNLDGLED